MSPTLSSAIPHSCACRGLAARARALPAAVRVQRDVRGELVRHVVAVVLAVRLEPGGHGVEPGGFRRQLARLRVGAPYDQGERAERWIGQLVLVEERVERAALAAMAELDIRHVVGDRAFPLGD